MEEKRKIAAKSRQLSYYIERKYEESPILKSMDPYRQELPIGYAKNCTRRMDVRESTKDCKDDLGFGIIHARYLDHALLFWTVWTITTLSRFLT